MMENLELHQEAEPVQPPRLPVDANLACTRAMMNLPDLIFENILKRIYAEDPNKLRKLCRVSRIWDAKFQLFAKPETVTTLFVMGNLEKPKYEKLKARFFGGIELANARSIRFLPNFEPNRTILEEYYPSVKQLIISQQYFGLINFWVGKLTHLSVQEDKGLPKLTHTNAREINQLTTLRHLDLVGHFGLYLDLMRPTLARLNHLSVHRPASEFSRRDFLDITNLWNITLPESLSNECKSLWFVSTIGCIIYEVQRGRPQWFGGLVQFCFDMNGADEVVQDDDDDREFMTGLSENVVNLKELRLLNSIVTLDPAMVGQMARFVQLIELHCGFNIHHEDLLASIATNQLRQWPTVLIAHIEIRDFLSADGDILPSAFDFVKILSSILPNVQRLSIKNSEDSMYIDQIDLEQLVPQIDGFRQLLWYKLYTDEGFVGQERTAPGQPFKNIVAEEQEDEETSDDDSDYSD